MERGAIMLGIGAEVWGRRDLAVAKETQEHEWKMYTDPGVVKEWYRTNSEQFWQQLCL